MLVSDVVVSLYLAAAEGKQRRGGPTTLQQTKDAMNPGASPTLHS